MALTKLTDDLNVVQGLPDSPNAGVGGLTSTQLKVKFDTAGNAIKDYLNNTLTSETDAQLALKAPVDSPTFTGTPTVTQLQYNTAGGTSGIGKMAWNTTDGTLEFGLTGGNVTLQVGQEEVLRVLNNTGSTIPNGAVVYITGASGQRPTIALAQGNSEATSSKTIGVATESIANNQQGFITLTGLVRDLNTSAFTEGVSLWLSPTVAGGITSTKPVAPNHSVLVGFCIRSHATQGVILAKVQNGNELDELHDVLIGTLANKDLLAYDSAAGVWKNQTFTTLDLPTKTYVDSQDATKVNISGGTLNNGTLGGTTTTISATTTTVTGAADFQGVTTATTQSPDNNTTRVATTAFVLGQASITNPVMNGTAAIGTSTRFAKADHVHPSDTTKLSRAGGTMTGQLTADGGGSSILIDNGVASGRSSAYLDFANGTNGKSVSTGWVGFGSAGNDNFAISNRLNAPIVMSVNSGQEVARFVPSATIGQFLIGYTTSNGASYRLQVNSQIFATSSTIATSDGRYKENVNKIENALDIVNKLNPVTFNWKKHKVHEFDTKNKTTGFIAQEVYEALKDTDYVNSVVKKNDCEYENDNGEIVKEEFLGIAEGNLIAILTKSIQELNKRVEELEAKVGV